MRDQRMVMESLEGRWMMAVYAPESVGGLVFSADVLSQSGAFAEWKGFQLRMVPSNGTYHLIESSGLKDNTGFYTYSRINENTGALILHDPFSNLAVSHWLFFDSADTATFYASGHANGVAGHQFGTLEVLRTRIEGTVFDDANGNFLRGAGEGGLAGETIFLDFDRDGVLDAGEPSTITDSEGGYAFENLYPNTYHVQLAVPAEQRATTGIGGYLVNLTAGQQVTRNFGVTARPLVSGVVFADTNRDAQRNAGEAGLADVRVFLDANDNGQYDVGENHGFTNSAGEYYLSVPATGSHRIRAVAPDGRVLTQPGSEFHVVADSPGASLYGRNFGFAPAQTGSIIGTVFNDANGNYAKGSEETGRAGETVYLDLNQNDLRDLGEPTAVTDIAGAYAFEELAPGTYRLRLDTPDWHRATMGGRGYSVSVTTGQLTRDFGVTDRPLVSGVVFSDANVDGQRGAAEEALAGVRVFLDSNANGQYDAGENFVFTNASGAYFLNVPADVANPVRIVPPEGFAISQPMTGAHFIVGSPGASLYGRNFGVAPSGLFSHHALVDLDDDHQDVLLTTA